MECMELKGINVGDVVILKSDINKAIPIKLTVLDIFDEDEVICLWSCSNGDIKERHINRATLTFPEDVKY
jgi:hypothetical protein